MEDLVNGPLLSIEEAAALVRYEDPLDTYLALMDIDLHLQINNHDVGGFWKSITKTINTKDEQQGIYHLRLRDLKMCGFNNLRIVGTHATVDLRSNNDTLIASANEIFIAYLPLVLCPFSYVELCSEKPFAIECIGVRLCQGIPIKKVVNNLHIPIIQSILPEKEYVNHVKEFFTTILLRDIANEIVKYIPAERCETECLIATGALWPKNADRL